MKKNAEGKKVPLLKWKKLIWSYVCCCVMIIDSQNDRLDEARTSGNENLGGFTIAIIKTAGGLDLLQIPDRCCPPTSGYSSFRVGNLAYNSGPIDVLMSDGRVV